MKKSGPDDFLEHKSVSDLKHIQEQDVFPFSIFEEY